MRHQEALAGLFSQVLGLCARAGLVSLGVIALDGTKIAADASAAANRAYEQIAAELLAEADAIDAAEDRRFGETRGDELPAELADPVSRRARLREAKHQMESEHQVAVDAHCERLARRAEWEAEEGRRMGGRKPKAPPERVPPQTKVNLTDPDSRPVRTQRGFIQGYNAQAVATTSQIIIAAEIMGNGTDYGLLEPVVRAASEELSRAGIKERIGVALADAGYWTSEQIENLAADGIQALVPPDGHNTQRRGANHKGPRYDFMRRTIASDHGSALYRQRKRTIEPIFGQIKHNRHITRFQRRGIHACRAEWRLITATHNLLKLWRAQTVPAAA